MCLLIFEHLKFVGKLRAITGKLPVECLAKDGKSKISNVISEFGIGQVY